MPSILQAVGGGGTRFVAEITLLDETDTPDRARRERWTPVVWTPQIDGLITPR